MESSPFNGFRRLKFKKLHHAQGNQYFRYNLITKQIHHGSVYKNECIDMYETRTDAGSVFINECDQSSPTQQWNWAVVNETALSNWIVHGTEIIDKKEVSALNES